MMFLQKRFAITAFSVLTCFVSIAQECSLKGKDICSDGNQSTQLTLNGATAGKMYALYLDGVFLESKYPTSQQAAKPIDFGMVAQFGTYTIFEFSRTADPEHPEIGKRINGSVNVFRFPDLILPEKLKIKSGKPVDFKPKANVEGCTFTWTARAESGSISGFSRAGQGIIHDTLKLSGQEQGTVIYTITPRSPESLGSCIGPPAELKVWITN